MHQILLVEDSEECQLMTIQALIGIDMNIRTAKSIKQAIHLIDSHKQDIDLVLLDLGLPDGHGLEVLNHIQSISKAKDIPVFLLTSKSDIESKVSAFSLGADDYLIKPIDPIELRARLDMRLRKTRTQKRSLQTIRKRNLKIDIALMKASLEKDNREIDLELTVKEFKILSLLVQNEGHVYSREELVKVIWGNSTHVLARTIDTHVCSLRKKLRSFASAIECIPSVGYRFYDERQIDAH